MTGKWGRKFLKTETQDFDFFPLNYERLIISILFEKSFGSHF